MIKTLFGTDGIRGTANDDFLTPESVLRIGMAAAKHFKNGDHRHKVVIGKDTRLSGYMLESALTSGFVSMGMDVTLVGPIPTPAVAMLTHSLRADLGVMLSASHNPYYDNGIKLFGPDGYKLSDSDETRIESYLNDDLRSGLSNSAEMGRAKRLDDATGRYVEYVKNTFPKGLRLDGLKIVIDCANGAAYKVAPEVLWELGAEIVAMNVDPDGFNINESCGSLNPDSLKKKVLNCDAHLGLALDGDADRVLICDEKGEMVNGDQILALIADDWHSKGLLMGNGVVATVMSNLGLEKYLEDRGLKLLRTQVGDRYVVEKMRSKKCNVGGEQSGHIVLGDYSSTGDGLIAALQVLAILVARKGQVSKICRPFKPIPQILRNIRSSNQQSVDTHVVREAVKNAELRLSDCGRVLIRKSGTEPIIRVMLEGEDQGLIDLLSQDIISAITGGIN